MKTKRNVAQGEVEAGFETACVILPISALQPLHSVTDAVKKTRKFEQIVSSVREVGIIEPPVVARIRKEPNRYLLLDGHLRIEILKSLGHTEVSCLISTDDEAYTYNRRVNRLAIIQEHRMILKAVERGVPEKRLASVLRVDITTLRSKIRLLDGICPEAADLLKDKHVASNTFWTLKKMVPLRQIETAELMVAMNKYTSTYATALLAATPEDQLVSPHKPKVVKGLSDEQMTLMERESSNLEREFKIAEQSYGTDHLDLVLAKGYLAKLLRNPRIVRYLTQHYQEYLGEFQKLADIEKSQA